MVIDDLVRHYRNGACFAMAEALHRLTGFPVRCIDFGGFVHAFVVSPQDEVIDIHGKMPWNDFLSFLVDNNALPAHAVDGNQVVHETIPKPGADLFWIDRGYKPPSASAITKALAVARKHPNLSGVL